MSHIMKCWWLPQAKVRSYLTKVRGVSKSVAVPKSNFSGFAPSTAFPVRDAAWTCSPRSSSSLTNGAPTVPLAPRTNTELPTDQAHQHFKSRRHLGPLHIQRIDFLNARVTHQEGG